MKIMRKLFISLIITMMSLYQLSFATTLTSTLKSSALLGGTCSIQVKDISFGTINPGINNFSQGGVSVICNKNVSYTMIVNDGSYYYYGIHWLKAQSSSELLPFGLCTMATVWCGGDGNQTWTTNAGASSPISGAGTGVTQTYPMFAFITSDYEVPDNYSSTLVMTISY